MYTFKMVIVILFIIFFLLLFANEKYFDKMTYTTNALPMYVLPRYLIGNVFIDNFVPPNEIGHSL